MPVNAYKEILGTKGPQLLGNNPRSRQTYLEDIDEASKIGLSTIVIWECESRSRQRMRYNVLL